MKYSPLVIALLLFIHFSWSHPVHENRNFYKHDTSSTKVGFNIKCTSCIAAISFMSLVVKADASEPVILEFAKVICKLFAKQSWVVCDGISDQFRDEFFYVFRRLSSSSPSQLCGILLPDCSDITDPSQAGWEVYIPPKPKVSFRRPRIAGAKTVNAPRLRILQLSDLHIDYDYKPGAEAKCGLPVCCQNLVENPLEPAGYWGTAGSCDVPFHTFEHMLDHISKTEQLDYVILSGDFLNHVDWTYSKEKHIYGLNNISQSINKYFPNIPTYWTVGNHEGVPVNSFAPHSMPDKFWPTWLYGTLANVSQPWINKAAIETTNYRGSYVTLPAKGLRLISLNTGYCETTNFFLYLNQSDPDGTMSWLVSELVQAEKLGDVVQIVAHIPPGNEECLEGWARNYYRVVQRFSKTIVGQFFGHVHLDYFTIFYEDMNDPTSKPVGVGYAAPSVTTFTDMNPAYRIYTADGSKNYEIVDIENYYAEISKADENNPPVWEKLYSAKEAYKLDDLSPNSWNELIKKIYKDEDVSQQFFKNAYRQKKEIVCDMACRSYLLCQLRSGHHNNTALCSEEIQSYSTFDSFNYEKTYLEDNRIPL